MLGAALSEANAERIIAEEIQGMKDRGLPFTWMLNASATSTDVGNRLLAEGLQPVSMPEMWVSLNRLEPPPTDQDRIEVREVTGPADLAVWAETLSRASGVPPIIAKCFASAAQKIGLGPGSPFRPFLAMLDGKPAGTSSLMTSVGVAGVYNVGTVEEARRNGVGAAATYAALIAGRDSGLSTGILFASAMGLPVYRKMGFSSVGDMTMYVWHGPPAE
jgi:hypothetical protein